MATFIHTYPQTIYTHTYIQIFACLHTYIHEWMYVSYIHSYVCLIQTYRFSVIVRLFALLSSKVKQWLLICKIQTDILHCICIECICWCLCSVSIECICWCLYNIQYACMWWQLHNIHFEHIYWCLHNIVHWTYMLARCSECVLIFHYLVGWHLSYDLL